MGGRTTCRNVKRGRQRSVSRSAFKQLNSSMSENRTQSQELSPEMSPADDGRERPEALLQAEEDGKRDSLNDAHGREHDREISWRDVGGFEAGRTATIDSWMPHRAGWSIFLERIALAFEKPANRLIGTAQLNPFYHTGTIATFLLILVPFTGFYLFLFYQYGFDASYNAVLTRIEAPFIARTIRAIHRYASGALIMTSLLHAYRILFMERLRGPRWLAWVTGIFMTLLLWVAGVTGYLLIWDQRAQLINDAFVEFLQSVSPWPRPIYLRGRLTKALQTFMSSAAQLMTA